jgi:hypothetical protein
MRHPIDTAPKDGKFVILEDDVSGSFEFAQWSAEAGQWVRENGKPSEITPTHWQTMHLPQEGDEFILQDEFIPPEETRSITPPASQEPRSFRFPAGQAAAQRMADAGSLRQVANADPLTVARVGAQAAQGRSERGPAARRWFALSSIAAVMVGAALIGWYFQAELAGYVTRYSGELNNVKIGTGGVEVAEQKTPVPIQDSQKADSLATGPALHQQADRASSQAPRDSAQGRQGAEAMRPEAQQPLEKERRRAEALANEQTAQLSKAAETATAELRQSLQKERDRAEALAGELAKARSDIETQQALPSKARDQTAQRNQAAEKATAELRQSLKAEHDRAEALTGELAKARRDLETQAALSSRAGDEAAQVKKAAESATAELRQSLQKESDRAEALTSELAKAKREIETQLARSSEASDEAAQVKKAAQNATAELRQSLQKEHERSEALSSELARTQRDTKTQVALSSKAGDEAVQVKKAAESATSELQQERERAQALASELAKARREIEAQAALSSTKSEEEAQLKRAAETATTGLQQSVQQERERAEALAGELAKARREIEAQAALSSKKDDEAAQLKRAAETATAKLQQSLQQQRDKTLALESELAMARRGVEPEVATSRTTDDEAAQLKQATKNAQAELRQSPPQERDKPGEPARGPKSTAGPVGARLPLAANNQTTQVKQTTGAAATEQLVAAEPKGSAEAARLLARASALLGQGNIGAAQIVLERAIETGSAQASFMLAETYDPLVLSTWKTYGTRGDVAKARELYAKALAGGIQEAKNRSVALR